MVPQGTVFGDLSWRFIGLSVEAGLAGSTQLQLAPAIINASTQWATVSARTMWTPLERVMLELQLGARLTRVAALATGISDARAEQVALVVGASGSLGATIMLVGPLGIVLRATGTVREPVRLVVDQVGVVELGPLEGAVHAGVVARW